MIENNLLKTNFIGKDGFRWRIGQVAPEPAQGDQLNQIGNTWGCRMKVRIYGYHPADITELKEQLQTAVDGATHQAELANALKESTSSVKDIRLGYRQKAQDLEKVYGEKINWLINRVEQLENSRSRPESNASSSVSSSRSNSSRRRNSIRSLRSGCSGSSGRSSGSIGV